MVSYLAYTFFFFFVEISHLIKIGECVNLAVRVNPTKQENQQAKLERYFL